MAKTYYIESDLTEIADQLGDNVNRLAGKTILISGGCGFLGRYFTHFILHLNKNVLKKPCKMIVLDNLITSILTETNGSEFQHLTFIKHDVIKPITLEEQIDYIIHAAGIASPYYYRKYPLETLEVAVTGTKNLLELARQHRVQGFLFFSSSEIYGNPNPNHIPTLESYRGNLSCLGPRACYDESKRLGETLCTIFHKQYGVITKIVRPFNIYGPGMKEKDYRVLPNFASRIVGGKPLHIYGDGNQTRTFCYVTDSINGFLRTILIGTPGEVYNIGNPKPEISMVDLAKVIQQVLNRKLEIVFLEYPDAYPPDEPLRRCPDITKARLQLSYDAKVELQEGLRRFMGWALENYTGVD